MLPVNWTKLKESLGAHPLVRAFGISVLLHFLAFFALETGFLVGMWKVSLVQRSKLKQYDISATDSRSEILKKNEQVVIQFIEVDPAQATAEQPKDARLYSTANTQAANPDTRDNSNVPKIEGSQTVVPRTMDVVKPEPQPQPVFPPAKPGRAEMQPTTKAAPAEPVGDTKQNTLTPEEKAQRDLTFDQPAPKQPPRPRTLADARQQKGIVEGPKIQQQGGVNRFALESSMDVKNSPFGSYDAQFIAAVQARWDALLANHDRFVSGKVVVDFRLNSDGRISHLNVTLSEVTQSLTMACQRAILDPAPYAKFPADLRRILGQEYREVRFTFHYH